MNFSQRDSAADADDPALSADDLFGRGRTQIDRLVAEEHVRVHLPDNAAIYGDRLLADRLNETMEIEGKNVVLVSDRLMADRGRHVIVRQGKEEARWEGDGRARLFREPVTDEFLLSPPEPELAITWTENVLVTLVRPEGSEDARGLRPRDVDFRGNVNVTGEEFWLDADRLGIALPMEGEENTAIDEIHATGSVLARSRRDEGALRCRDLRIRLRQREDGGSAPESMVAMGGVVAADAAQTVWTDMLEATFREEPAGAPTADPAEADSVRVGGMLETVSALGQVQIRLSEGGRAWADRMTGNAIAETLELTGENVVVARDTLLIDEAKQVLLNGATESARWRGPGRARVYEHAVEPMEADPVAYPRIDEGDDAPQLFVNWSDEMTFDNAFNEGAGALTLRGDVEALATPSRRERNTMTGRALTLQFDLEASEDGLDPAPRQEEPGESAGGFDGQARQRRLAVLIADGEAKLESRTWSTDEQAGTPRIFYIAGAHIEYDDRKTEAHVFGDGTLLIRDLTPPEDGDAAEADTPFTAKGVTRFRWDDELHLTQQVPDRFEIVMTGDVRAEHQALDGEVSILRGDYLEASVARERTTQLSSKEPAGPLRIGGRMTLKRLAASGGVSIRTPTRDVHCDAFDYDLFTRFAQVSASPGRRVSVLTRGTARPIQAERVLWNMVEDTVLITRGRASGAP